jgi:hypothetical protein
MNRRITSRHASIRTGIDAIGVFVRIDAINVIDAIDAIVGAWQLPRSIRPDLIYPARI